MKNVLAISGTLLMLLGFGVRFTARGNADLLSEKTAVDYERVSSHGSLAIDSNQGSAYGFAYNYSSSEDADEKALSECGEDCEVVRRFTDGCAAYAADQTSGSSLYGWGEDADGASARGRALSECQTRGGRRCAVRAWGCNDG